MTPTCPRRRLLLGWALLFAAPAWAMDCQGTPATREATSQQIGAFVRASGKQLLTFTGYSGAGYEDAAAMQAAAEQVLARHDPAQTLVNIGGTAVGIGEVYALAKARGFITLGIVSTLARDAGEPLSPCVDQVFFVRDTSWGGRLPGSTRLAPTSAAIVGNSHEFVGIGGGEVARDELRAARAAGKPVHFVPADMNHRIAIGKALAKGQRPPSDFRGAAHAVFAN
jgi:hypothetical protein